MLQRPAVDDKNGADVGSTKGPRSANVFQSDRNGNETDYTEIDRPAALGPLPASGGRSSNRKTGLIAALQRRMPISFRVLIDRNGSNESDEHERPQVPQRADAHAGSNDEVDSPKDEDDDEPPDGDGRLGDSVSKWFDTWMGGDARVYLPDNNNNR